jgi:hypothetical protein
MYKRSTSAAGAWTATLRGPAIPDDYYVAALRAVAHGCPLSGWTRFRPDADGMVILHRHPSQRHGTPDIADCDAAAHALADRLGWQIDQGAPRIGIITAVGRREGYGDTAVMHDQSVFEEYLVDMATLPVTQWSARLVDGEIQWYDEPAVMVNTGPGRLDLIASAAARTRQHQIVVTDYDADETYTLVQQAPAGQDGQP